MAGVAVYWRQGFGSYSAQADEFNKVVSSLVFRQAPVSGKRAGIEAMFDAAKAGGTVCKADTQPNVDGFLEAELSKYSDQPVKLVFAIDTPTGTISIFREPKAVR